MSSLVLPCLGLAPDMHAQAAPKGSMRHAENVVCDLPGIVRARPSFELGTNKSSAYYPIAMHVFGSTRIVVTFNGTLYRLESEAATITGYADPVSFNDRETAFAEARKSLYYCTSYGVQALRTEAGSTTEAAGMDASTGISLGNDALQMDTTYPGPFTVGDWAYAHCMVVKRTDANGYVKRSAPTPRIHSVCSVGIGQTASIILAAGPISGNRACAFLSGSLIAGDVVEFYRTQVVAWTSGITLAADMYLVYSYTVTATDVSNGYFPPSQVELRDVKENTALGEALYTNPQREGILASKRTPPIAQEIALWQSCMWYGRTKDRHRVTLSFDLCGDMGGTDYWEATAEAFGKRNTTGDVAANVTLTNVASITGVVPGMYVCATSSLGPFESPSSSVIPAGTTVVSTSGAGPYSVVMSQAGTGASVGLAITFCDKVTVANVPFAGWSAQPMQIAASGGRQSFVLTNSSSQSSLAYAWAANLCRVINDAYAAGLCSVRAVFSGTAGVAGGGGVAPGPPSFIIERAELNAASFTVTSTKPQGLSPYELTSITSTQDDKPHRVCFSLPDEPEAVPLLNYIDIGSEKAAIQRLIPLADALLVFKEDGLYRITGSAPDRWNVSLLDPTLRLVRPEACAVLADTVYAWTNRGVVSADESGVRQVISNGKIDTELFSPQGAILGDDGYHGCRVLTSQRHHLVLVTVPNWAVESPGPLSSSTVYCFSAKTGMWTKWPMYIRCGDSGSDGVLWIAANNSLNELEWETRYLRDTARGYDRLYTVGAGSGAPTAWTQTASSTAMSITNAQRNEWVPTVGDWIYWTIGSDYWRRIIAVTDAGGGDYSWTLDSAAPSNIASASAKGCVVGTPILLEWLPSAAGNAGMSLPVWRGVTFALEGEATAKTSPTDFRVTFGVRHDGSATVATVTGTPDRSLMTIRPYRMGWPRNAARRPDVGPRLSWSEIDWPWRLSGIALIGEDGSERVRT